MFEFLVLDENDVVVWKAKLNPAVGDLVEQITDELQEVRQYLANGGFSIRINPV